ncbi:MAG: hypothetical protein MAG551_01009 [Candidatus Scalindua arabica]|uniref:Uncharacterized protein n=1 Tax=Candidatus Scalindua arabica TaxID=1127984 RepID=A0A942A1R3_9BACT|nr:hypothetical protein [Candidatus Scalindua arabica]
MNTSCEKLPLVDLNAQKAESHRSRAGKVLTEESIEQDQKDAEGIMSLTGLDQHVSLDNKIEAREKYMIETRPNESKSPTSKTTGMGMKVNMRKPHYTFLFAFDNKMVFQAACCLPLKVIAASLDGDIVFGKALYDSHSGNEGGKLVYEFQGEGSELIIDVRRGESTKAQRLTFKI